MHKVAKSIILSVIVFLIALLSLNALHTKLVQERALIPIKFNHQKHSTVNCLTCHHDYADRSPSAPNGERTCLACHKKTPTLASYMEEHFHTFCRDCHLDLANKNEDAGPLRLCSHCHKQ